MRVGSEFSRVHVIKILLLILVLVTLWFWPIIVHADEREIEEIPEEHKQLTFEKVEVSKSEQIANHLFQKAIQETNTIQSKTKQIGLFSTSEQTVKMETESQTGESSPIIIVFMIVGTVMVLIVVFVLIIPKLKKGNN